MILLRPVQSLFFDESSLTLERCGCPPFFNTHLACRSIIRIGSWYPCAFPGMPTLYSQNWDTRETLQGNKIIWKRGGVLKKRSRKNQPNRPVAARGWGHLHDLYGRPGENRSCIFRPQNLGESPHPGDMSRTSMYKYDTGFLIGLELHMFHHFVEFLWVKEKKLGVVTGITVLHV